MSPLPKEHWVVVAACPVRHWLLLLREALAHVVGFRLEITASLYVCRGSAYLVSQGDCNLTTPACTTESLGYSRALAAPLQTPIALHTQGPQDQSHVLS